MSAAAVLSRRPDACPAGFAAPESSGPPSVELSGAVAITASAALVLKLICEARRIEPQESVLRALVTYARDSIGLPGLLVDEDLQSGEAVSRVAHNHEVPRSNRGSATSCPRASVSAREDGAVLPLPDGDLTDVPEVPRVGANRYADAARAPP